MAGVEMTLDVPMSAQDMWDQVSDLSTLGDWLVWLVAPLHFGTSWGQTVKALWALLGLALPLLTITGMLMYWNRYLSKRWRRLTAPGNR